MSFAVTRDLEWRQSITWWALMRHAPSGVPMAVWRHLGSASMQLHMYHMFSSLTPMCALNSQTSPHLYATYQDHNPDDTCSEHSDVAKGGHRFCLKVKKKTSYRVCFITELTPGW